MANTNDDGGNGEANGGVNDGNDSAKHFFAGSPSSLMKEKSKFCA
ncbi:hypothetical protein A2U01_0044505, partial [Trifolium medium]|nr:hypothetical protein [Trifolium medium]